MSTGTDSKGWWATLPGMLTAFAGLLTAVTGLVVALDQIGALGGEEADEPAATVAEETRAAPNTDPPVDEAAPLAFDPVGSDGPAATSPGAVVLRYYAALQAGDWVGMQATLAPNAEIDVASLRMVRSQAGALNQISDQLTTLFEVPEETKGAPSTPAIGDVRIEGVRRSNGNARVLVVPADGVAPARHTMELVRVGRDWKIVRQGAAP